MLRIPPRIPITWLAAFKPPPTVVFVMGLFVYLCPFCFLGLIQQSPIHQKELVEQTTLETPWLFVNTFGVIVVVVLLSFGLINRQKFNSAPTLTSWVYVEKVLLRPHYSLSKREAWLWVIFIFFLMGRSQLEGNNQLQ